MAIKVGAICDLTGPMSFMGIADANVARMVVDDINAGGGLLGRSSSSTSSTARRRTRRRRPVLASW